MFTSAAFIDKHVDDLLQAGGSCFQEAYKENSLGIAIADIQGNILDLNEHYADIVGYSSCELIGVDTVQFSYHEEIKIEIERYRQFVTRKRSYSRLKKRYITLAGEDVQTDSFVKLVHSDSDESSIFVGLFLETDRYTAPVAKSTLSDKAFHQLFEIAAMPLAVVNANKEFVLVNAKYRQIIGHAIKDAPTINHWCRLAFPNANYYHWISKEIESCITQDQHTSIQVEKILQNILSTARMELSGSWLFQLLSSRIITLYHSMTLLNKKKGIKNWSTTHTMISSLACLPDHCLLIV
jgi:PAS domain S-box-containing protein